nr:Protein CHROMATIN REMODELING 25 [Ipomoea batatas]GMD14322.1 Protein CHROMATIN REMODELING 25 [Ipomoea batatas]
MTTQQQHVASGLPPRRGRRRSRLDATLPRRRRRRDRPRLSPPTMMQQPHDAASHHRNRVCFPILLLTPDNAARSGSWTGGVVPLVELSGKMHVLAWLLAQLCQSMDDRVFLVSNYTQVARQEVVATIDSDWNPANDKQSNTVLEAFGKVKTVRNNNSFEICWFSSYAYLYTL